MRILRIAVGFAALSKVLRCLKAAGSSGSGTTLCTSSRPPEGGCRYVDVIDLDAGPFTPIAAAIVSGIFRYLQSRLRNLANRHLAVMRD